MLTLPCASKSLVPYNSKAIYRYNAETKAELPNLMFLWLHVNADQISSSKTSNEMKLH